ncbi:Exosome complex exonuclease RRP6 [Carex littledalei]|uniref:Exosome complex exonuclease RRP6 n=1 Tax=Carex littledalei TaxID=544730 RepID=A0A833R5Y0_9POAL|nr:Exosome complex exonuclease RRP6 [Carex littledalei]
MPGSPEKTVAAIAVACLVTAISAALLLRRHHRRSSPPRTERGDARELRCSDSGEKKPQEKFKRLLADNSYSPFKHLNHDTKGSPNKLHPYEEDITHLLLNPPTLPMFVSDNGNAPLDMSCSYTWVDTEPQLESLAGLLRREKVFAVDTEQHSFRSFLGFTALMQISTVEEDFLIDTIALHDAMGILRPVFADSSICKVFHGADNDVIWLQRDFHIYVVNMFDTAKACEILSKPQKSLAYLLEVYCGVITDKTLQREDWRIRPLSVEMIEYARCDAHYLLYIANRLSSELHSKTTSDSSSFSDDKINFFFEASRRSNLVCMQLYTKEIEPSPGASAATSIFSRILNQELDPSRISELKDIIWKLCAWRDLMVCSHP